MIFPEKTKKMETKKRYAAAYLSFVFSSGAFRRSLYQSRSVAERTRLNVSGLICK